MGNDLPFSVRVCLLLTGLALLMLLPAAALRPPARQQELRVLISARNMVTTGDWLRPEFQNQPRYRKPPMPYWLAATAMLPDGKTDSEFRARLPFVLTSILMLCTLFLLSGSRTGPLLMLASFGFWRFAPLAETDMVNALGICLAMLGFQKRLGGLSAVGMILAILSKGPAGLAIPFATFLFLRGAQSRSLVWWLKAFLPPITVGLGWLIFLLKDPVASAALQAEISDTFIASPNFRSPLFYFYTLPAMLGPAFFIAFPRKCPKPERSLPWVWFGVTFLLLTLTPSKQNHYTLMLLPPAVWLLSPFAGTKHLVPMVLLAIFAGIGGDVARSRFHAESLHSQFLKEIRPHVEEAPLLFVVGINSARFDFHLGRHVHNLDSADRAIRQANPTDAVVIIQRMELFDREPVDTPFDRGDAAWNRLLILKE